MLTNSDYSAAIAAALSVGSSATVNDLFARAEVERLARVWLHCMDATDGESATFEDACQRVRAILDQRAVPGAGAADWAVMRECLVGRGGVIGALHKAVYDQYTQHRSSRLPSGKHVELHEVVYMNMYDSFVIDDRARTWGTFKLLGNANVGISRLCNLPVACQLAPGHNLATIVSWWITSVPRVQCMPGVATLSVNGKLCGTVLMQDLLHERQVALVDVPPRVATDVEIQIDNRYVYLDNVRYFLHLDGWRTRDII